MAGAGAALVYDTSLWARNFTFGMFYAFTVAIAGRLEAGAPAILARVTAAIAGGGQYLVLALLVAELALMGCCLACRFRTAASSRRAG